MACQFDRLVRIFSTLLPPVALGCGPESIDPDQFSDDLCSEGELHVLDALQPGQPIDYVELRQAENYGTTEQPDWQPPAVLDATGELCSGASDPGACLESFAALSLQSEFVFSGAEVAQIHRSLGFTRADEVAAIASRMALTGFLGAVDAPGDAALVAMLDGHALVCDAGDDVGRRGDAYVVHTRSGGGCGASDDIEEHVLLVHPDGTIEVVQSVLVERGDPGCAIGRLPAGLIRSRTRRCTHPVGSFFAEVAHLEAAAIAAFEQLRTELFVHGAPMQLVRRAERARRDEIRHARITAALARRYHGHPRAPRLQPRWSPRSLVEIAADNAVEGCIRETYGALVAHAQAIQARDPRLRRILHQIARDETQHAALSWDIARWAESRGSAAERRTVALRTAYALEPLRAELTRAYAEQVHTVTGLPRPDQARALYDGLRSALFGRPS